MYIVNRYEMGRGHVLKVVIILLSKFQKSILGIHLETNSQVTKENPFLPHIFKLPPFNKKNLRKNTQSANIIISSWSFHGLF